MDMVLAGLHRLVTGPVYICVESVYLLDQVLLTVAAYYNTKHVH